MLICILVVLVGNEDNIDLSGGLEEIFIDNLVKNMGKVKGKLIEILNKMDGLYHIILLQL